MKKEALVASIDGDTTIKRERRMPGPAPKPRATCAYAGCSRLVKLNATYCSISHAKLGKPSTKALNRIAPTPQLTHSFVTTVDDLYSPLIVSIEE